MSAFIKNAQYSNDGIDVLRATQQDQVQLNMMADQKSNIVIGVTLIFFTLTQRQLVSGMGEYELLILPLITLATAMFGSFVLSVLVVAPKMRRTRRCKPEEMANPLFFGAFQGVSEDEFAAYLEWHSFRPLGRGFSGVDLHFENARSIHAWAFASTGCIWAFV